MPETQNQDAPQQEAAENSVVPQATEPAADPAPAAPAEEKHERLAESELEASHSDVLPLSPIENSSSEPARDDACGKKRGRHGLRRGNAGRGNAHGAKDARSSVGIVENPQEAKESLSGKFVDGYEKEKEFRRARERREKAEAAARGDAAPAAQGWELTSGDVDASRRRHPQSNTGAARAKLIIEPAPIPVQEKDPSVWQKFKAKLLALFGLDKKKNNKKKNGKKRRGGKRRNGKKFYNGENKGGEFRNREGGEGRRQEFRGGNRRSRHGKGPRPGNSGARPQNNGGGNGGGSAPSAS